MTRFIITLLFFPLGSSAFAQSAIKNYVQQHAVSIASIQPDLNDFQDLEAIGEAIGDSKVVMLGEQDHGDAPTYLAKTRLIKFLHEKMGFNVLAFEADLFALNYGWNRLEKRKPVMDTFLMQNVTALWTLCNTCHDLFYDYLPATSQTAAPLLVTGFDNQINSPYSQRLLIATLDSTLQSMHLSATRQENYRRILTILDTFQQAPFARRDRGLFDTCNAFLGQVKAEMVNKPEKDDFWLLVVDNLLQKLKQFDPHNSFVEGNNIRDEQMAKNLQWLANTRFPERKIIVWAANEHIARYNDKSWFEIARQRITMGNFFAADSFLNKKTYHIGFTSYAGSAGRLSMNTYRLKKPQHNNFEQWISKSMNYAFVDWRSYSGEQQQFFMKGLGHKMILKKNWNRIFDGIFFIRDMYPCKSILQRNIDPGP